MIHHGNLLDVLPTFAPHSIDAVVTDPPYELSFMGKKWDRTGVAFSVQTWVEIFRVLKPGGYLLAFGGTRTFHRMTCAIEDAGFDIRDCLSWLYGQGFPKSQNVSKAFDDAAGETRPVVATRGTKAVGLTDEGYTSRVPDEITAPVCAEAKQWDGWGTALKPSWEPIIMARKPMSGTMLQNIRTHGTGPINIDACRIETSDDLNGGAYAERGSERDDGWGMQRTGGAGEFVQPLGRWPANVLLDEDAAAVLDEMTGELTSGRCDGGFVGEMQESVAMGRKRALINPESVYGDSGGASRFYYVAKPSREERDYGCDHLPRKTGGEATDREDGSAGVNNPRAGAGRTGGSRNFHPTVKPIELMRWLVKLVTPPNGVVLDPFTGSGTTGMACRYEQRQFIGVEREADYVRIAEARISAVAPLFG